MKAMPYDVACALRGPDFNAPTLKWIFTQRIRFFCIGLYLEEEDVLGDIRYKPLPNDANPPFAKEELLRWNKEGDGAKHFIIHAWRALRCLLEAEPLYRGEIQYLIDLIHEFARITYEVT